MASPPRASRIDDAYAQLPPIYFYYPPGAGEDAARASVDTYAYRAGNYVWTAKTYGALSRLGFPCQLAQRLPDEGIVVTHREFFTNTMVPSARQLFVCVVADFYRHPFAQLHLVQNPNDPMLLRRSPAWPAAFLPSLPEAGLIPRDPARGDTFVNVSYFGLPARLAPQLRSKHFASLLRQRGFDLRLVESHRWNDYSDTDAVLAVRSFAPVSFHKYPPSKLYNSWIARVPALLGCESAYRAERRSEYDYFEVRGVDEVLRTLERLRSDPVLRAAVARNCAARAAEVSANRIVEKWVDVLTRVAAPAYEAWRRRPPASRYGFLANRALRYGAFVCSDFVLRAGGYVHKRLRALRP